MAASHQSESIGKFRAGELTPGRRRTTQPAASPALDLTDFPTLGRWLELPASKFSERLDHLRKTDHLPQALEASEATVTANMASSQSSRALRRGLEVAAQALVELSQRISQTVR